MESSPGLTSSGGDEAPSSSAVEPSPMLSQRVQDRRTSSDEALFGHTEFRATRDNRHTLKGKSRDDHGLSVKREGKPLRDRSKIVHSNLPTPAKQKRTSSKTEVDIHLSGVLKKARLEKAQIDKHEFVFVTYSRGKEETFKVIHQSHRTMPALSPFFVFSINGILDVVKETILIQQVVGEWERKVVTVQSFYDALADLGESYNPKDVEVPVGLCEVGSDSKVQENGDFEYMTRVLTPQAAEHIQCEESKRLLQVIKTVILDGFFMSDDELICRLALSAMFREEFDKHSPKMLQELRVCSKTIVNTPFVLGSASLLQNMGFNLEALGYPDSPKNFVAKGILTRVKLAVQLVGQLAQKEPYDIVCHSKAAQILFELEDMYYLKGMNCVEVSDYMSDEYAAGMSILKEKDNILFQRGSLMGLMWIYRDSIDLLSAVCEMCGQGVTFNIGDCRGWSEASQYIQVEARKDVKSMRTLIIVPMQSEIESFRWDYVLRARLENISKLGSSGSITIWDHRKALKEDKDSFSAYRKIMVTCAELVPDSKLTTILSKGSTSAGTIWWIFGDSLLCPMKFSTAYFAEFAKYAQYMPMKVHLFRVKPKDPKGITAALEATKWFHGARAITKVDAENGAKVFKDLGHHSQLFDGSKGHDGPALCSIGDISAERIETEAARWGVSPWKYYVLVPDEDDVYVQYQRSMSNDSPKSKVERLERLAIGTMAYSTKYKKLVQIVGIVASNENRELNKGNSKEISAAMVDVFGQETVTEKLLAAASKYAYSGCLCQVLLNEGGPKKLIPETDLMPSAYIPLSRVRQLTSVPYIIFHCEDASATQWNQREALTVQNIYHVLLIVQQRFTIAGSMQRLLFGLTNGFRSITPVPHLLSVPQIAGNNPVVKAMDRKSSDWQKVQSIVRMMNIGMMARQKTFRNLERSKSNAGLPVGKGGGWDMLNSAIVPRGRRGRQAVAPGNSGADSVMGWDKLATVMLVSMPDEDDEPAEEGEVKPSAEGKVATTTNSPREGFGLEAGPSETKGDAMPLPVKKQAKRRPSIYGEPRVSNRGIKVIAMGDYSLGAKTQNSDLFNLNDEDDPQDHRGDVSPEGSPRSLDGDEPEGYMGRSVSLGSANLPRPGSRGGGFHIPESIEEVPSYEENGVYQAGPPVYGLPSKGIAISDGYPDGGGHGGGVTESRSAPVSPRSRQRAQSSDMNDYEAPGMTKGEAAVKNAFKEARKGAQLVNLFQSKRKTHRSKKEKSISPDELSSPLPGSSFPAHKIGRAKAKATMLPSLSPTHSRSPSTSPVPMQLQPMMGGKLYKF